MTSPWRKNTSWVRTWICLRGQNLASCGARRLLGDRQRRHDGKSVSGPSMALNPDTVYTANEWIAGVAGGSVGVLGTLIQLELRQERVRSRRNCPYCNGSGKLICGECYSSGKVLAKLPGESSPLMLPCTACKGEKYIECLNCGGDGRAVPRALDKKTPTAAEVDMRLEEIGMSNMGQTMLPRLPRR